jgi:uncharacterized cupin superfamily protein
MSTKEFPAPRPPAFDPAAVAARTGSGYPSPFREDVVGRVKRALGDAAGLKAFGVNLVRLEPGAWSSQRHWHTLEDELIYVLEGELVLVTDAGEQVLGPGMAAGFPAGKPDGHHLINRSDRPGLYLEVGSRADDDACFYPDIDMEWRRTPDGFAYVHRNGKPY